MTWSSFLGALRGPGIEFALGVILSFVVEWLPNWDNLEARVKRVIMLALCLAVPLLATLLGILTNVYAGGFEDLWWPALVAGFAAFSGSTVAHIRKLGGGNGEDQ